MNSNIESMYSQVDKNFYQDQTASRNPLRKWFHVNRYRIANSLVKSKYDTDKEIVDLGCGSCEWNKDGLRVLGVDFNEGMLRCAKQDNRLYDYRVADVAETGLPAESFDIVTAFEVLEHLKDYEKVIIEAKRLLKRGGHFIISVPFDVPFSFWRPLFFLQVIFQGYILQNDYYKKRCGHVNHFSPEKISLAFVRQGLNIEYIFDMRRFTIFLCARKDTPNVASTKSYGDVTIILPTLNEGKSISNVLGYLVSRYRDCHILVADDGSKDGTKEAVLNLQHKNLTFLDRSSRLVHGITASVLDATAMVKTRYFVVMDADGQHPPGKIEEIVNILRLGDRVVIASRIKVEQGWSFSRKAISYIGTLLGKLSLMARKKNYLSYDILGGFFGCNTRFWKKCLPPRLKRCFRLKGYKVLFDFLKYAPSRLVIEEVYYTFETRKSGISKIQPKIYLEYLKSCFLP